MAIKDLLWACPICHQVESIDAAGRCRACGAAFSRGRGARILVRAPDETAELDPIAWLGRLPWPDLDGVGSDLPAGIRPPFQQPATVQGAIGELPLRRGPELLGFVERFGPQVRGTVTLSERELRFAPAGGKSGAGQGSAWCWRTADITAIQPASSSIQLKARGAPAVSIRFPEGSLRLWEQRFQYCVRRAYQAAGQGDVIEFQPHVRTR